MSWKPFISAMVGGTYLLVTSIPFCYEPNQNVFRMAAYLYTNKKCRWSLKERPLVHYSCVPGTSCQTRKCFNFHVVFNGILTTIITSHICRAVNIISIMFSVSRNLRICDCSPWFRTDTTVACIVRAPQGKNWTSTIKGFIRIQTLYSHAAIS